MSFLWGRGRNQSVSPDSTFRLTQQGREKLQEFMGDAKSQILVALETRGSSDVAEIALASGLSRGQVERMIPGLLRGGYIQSASAMMPEG